MILPRRLVAALAFLLLAVPVVGAETAYARYAYAEARPTFYIDPDGHEVLSYACYSGGNWVRLTR